MGYVVAKGVWAALTALKCIEFCDELSKDKGHQRQRSTRGYAGHESDGVEAPIVLVSVAEYPLSRSSQLCSRRPDDSASRTR